MFGLWSVLLILVIFIVGFWYVVLYYVICYIDILVGIDVDVYNDFVFVDFFIFFLVVRWF